MRNWERAMPPRAHENLRGGVSGVVKNHFTDNYPEPVWDNGVQCIDMIRMRADLFPQEGETPPTGQKL